jgi:tetratricopeptide (TPR) repeat protein
MSRKRAQKAIVLPARNKRASRAFLAIGTLLAILAILLASKLRDSVTVPEVTLPNNDPTLASKISETRNSVVRRPRSADAWGVYGMLLRALDFHSQARECFTQAEALDKNNPRWPYFLARELSDSDSKATERWLRRAVEICANSPETPRYYLARLLSEQGRWTEAEAELDPLLKAKPEFTPALLLKAQAQIAHPNFDSAISLAERCTNDIRTRKAAWASLAAIHQRKGEISAAQDAAKNAAAAPKDAPLSDSFENEVFAFRVDPQMLATQIHPLLASNKLAEAETLIEKLDKSHPDFPEKTLLLGRLRYLQKNFPAAETALNKHLELSPQSAQGVFQLGMVQLAQNKFPEAAETFTKATQLKPDFGPAWFNRGFALGRAGKLPESVEAFQQAIRHNPEHLESYLLLGDVYLRLGNKNDALQLLEQAKAIAPNDPRIVSVERKALSR